MPAELSELNSILHSGALAYGRYGKEFEQKLCSYIGVNQLLTVNTYNSAVLVVLITLGVKNGDEVITSPMACLASNQPLVMIGAKVVWADVDPSTGTLDPNSVIKKITSKTKAIFHNHFCGYPGYIDEINMIGRKYGIPVVDDSIEAFGSEYKGFKLGKNDTDVTIFSFQPVRLPTTIEGGAIHFKDKGRFERSLLVRDSGIDRLHFRDKLGEISPDCDISLPGFGATMSEVNSYIGLQQMNDLEMLLEKQRMNAVAWSNYIGENFSGISLLNNRNEILPNFWVFGILTDNKPETIIKFRDRGYYASGVHLRNNCYSVFGEKTEMKGVSEFNNHFLALPSGWWVDVNL